MRETDICLLAWKGLHVIKTVVDLKGLKRFKKKQDDDSLSTTSANFDLSNTAKAKEIFRKMSN